MVFCRTGLHSRGAPTVSNIVYGSARGLWILLPRPADIEDSIPKLSRNLWCLIDMLRSNTRRGRAPAENSDVLAMFRLVFSGEGATQPLVDDSS